MTYGLYQARIDKRMGQIGQKVGQPYSVYRADSSASGDFPSGWSVIGSTVNAYRCRIPITKIEAGVERAEILYDFFVNAGNYRLGDIFVCTDPALSPGISYGAQATILPSTLQFNAVALAWHMPPRVPTGARIDRRARIFRPSLAPGALAGGGGPYWKETNDNALPLKFSDGVFSFGSAGAGGASWIPAGFMSVTRRSDYPFDKEPGIVRSLAWMAYVPPLPGYQAAEGDHIITEDGARYVMLGAYNQEAGFVGTSMILDRKISQTA